MGLKTKFLAQVMLNNGMCLNLTQDINICFKQQSIVWKSLALKFKTSLGLEARNGTDENTASWQNMTLR